MKTATLKYGPLIFHWYGILIAVALLVGLGISIGMARWREQRADPLAGILLLGLLAGVIGARIWYVAFRRDFYAPDPARVFAIWEGGLALHGGLIGGMLATLIYTWSGELDFWTWADICVPGLIVAQAIGRLGDVANNQAFGEPTGGSLAVIIPPDNRPLQYLSYSRFQPVAAYEAAWDGLVFLLLIALALLQGRGRRLLPAGTLFAAYLILYSAGRLWLEGMRVDSLYLGTLRVAQVASIALIALGVTTYLARVIGWREQQPQEVPIVHGQASDAYLAAAARGNTAWQQTTAVQLETWDTASLSALSRPNGHGPEPTTGVLPALPETPKGARERTAEEAS